MHQQYLKHSCDLLTQQNLSEALKRKSNSAEQSISLQPLITLFNCLFEEIISLRRYVNEQLENVKKSQYDSKQSTKCDQSNGTEELQQLCEENRSKKTYGNPETGNNIVITKRLRNPRCGKQFHSA